MARISTYVIDGTIVDDDKVIGSDANNDMVTKNYKVGDLVAYFAVAIGGYLVPYTNATDDVDLGPYSLFATNLSISGTFTAGGTEGLTGQVLMSQGSGNPAVWGYNIGSQDLQDVLNNGNTGSRNILLGSFGSSIKLDVESNILPSTGIQLYDIASTNTSYWITNEIGLQDGSQTFIQLIDRTIYSNGTNSITVLASNYQNQTFIYPNYGGAFVMSVNGTFADMSGNINITPGSGGLGSVTQVNTSAPLTGGPITTTGTIGITQSSSSTDGYLSNTDWNAFDAKQDAITLTTTGTSGPATFAGNILNIPQYSGGSGGSQNLQQVVNIGNGISNFGGIGNASIQSTNFTNGRTLYLNDNSYPTIRLVDNANASNYLQIDIDTLNIDGTSYNWSSIVNPTIAVPTLQQVVTAGNTTVDKTITLTATGSSTFVRLYDNQVAVWDTGVANTISFLESSGFTINNVGVGSYFNIDTNTVNPTISVNSQLFTFPTTASGKFAISVNGITPNAAGNITVPVGASVGFEMNFLLMGA